MIQETDIGQIYSTLRYFRIFSSANDDQIRGFVRNDPLFNVAQIYTLKRIEIYGDKVEHK